MLASKNRLDRKNFNFVFQTGQRIQENGLILIFNKGKKFDYNNFKVGISVSKKNIKKSSARNLIKRRLYGALHFMIKNNHLIKNENLHDNFVIILTAPKAREIIDGIDFKLLVNELSQLFLKAQSRHS